MVFDVYQYNSCILPQLVALFVYFDLFGRKRDLSVAYSRDGLISDWVGLETRDSLNVL